MKRQGCGLFGRINLEYMLTCSKNGLVTHNDKENDKELRGMDTLRMDTLEVFPS